MIDVNCLVRNRFSVTGVAQQSTMNVRPLLVDWEFTNVYYSWASPAIICSLVLCGGSASKYTVHGGFMFLKEIQL